MMSHGPSWQTLVRSGSEGSGGTAVPRPVTRWVLRYVFPIVMVLLAVSLLAYAARDALLPAIEVDVVPVVTKAAGNDERAGASGDGETAQAGGREPQVISQAPGWIEPDPYAITVQALVSGVIEEMLVLEGDRVEQGQVIARLIADDANLALRRAQAALLESQAAIDRANADLAAAESRLAELDDEISRKRELVDAGGISPGEFARLEHRRRSRHSDVDAARAAIRQLEARLQRQQVEVEEAELALARTEIRAPVNGVVMARSAVPGTRIAIAGDGPGEQHFPGIVRLYDPASLQVRADVPLADAAKVGLGVKARITTEAVPDRTFNGEVTRIAHLADIQRNTVQVKVRINDPSPLLKPDMLVRVRFLSEARGEFAQRDMEAATVGDAGSGSLRVYAPRRALVSVDGDRAIVWTVEPGRDGRSRYAARREIELGHEDAELILVRRGLRPGDRLIVNPPPSIRDGSRVRIRQDALLTAESPEE